MSQEDYIKSHPEQFKDDIDKWLFLEFGIIGGCCSAEKSHEYHIARMVAEKLNDVFIKKAEKYLQEHLIDYWSQGVTDESGFIEEFKQFMKGE